MKIKKIYILGKNNKGEITDRCFEYNALENIYNNIYKITYPGVYYRRDIGLRKCLSFNKKFSVCFISRFELFVFLPFFIIFLASIILLSETK